MGAMTYISKLISEGYDDMHIEDVMQMTKGTVRIIRTLKKINYKEEVVKLTRDKKEDPCITGIVELYKEGFTFEELSYITKYSKEGIRNRIIAEIEKSGKDIEYLKGINSSSRKTLSGNVFYNLYVKKLEDKELPLVEVIKLSPYSEGTFLQKMKSIQ